MVEKPTMGRLGLVYPMVCHEGKITIVETSGVGGSKIEPVNETPVKQYMKVKLDGELAVAPASTGDTIIGVAYANPLDFETNPTKDYTAAQAKSAGMLRECSIETIFKKIETVKCKSGEDIAYGNYVKYGTADIDEFEKSTGATDMIALTNQSDSDTVVIGYKGGL